MPEAEVIEKACNETNNTIACTAAGFLKNVTEDERTQFNLKFVNVLDQLTNFTAEGQILDDALMVQSAAIVEGGDMDLGIADALCTKPIVDR